MRTSALVFTALVVLVPRGLSAQSIRGVGFFVGDVESRQLREREDDSATRNGIVAGAFVDVGVTGHWSVLTETAYAQRGGSYPTDQGGGEVQADYLEMTVAPSWHIDIAFVGAFAYAGPTAELSLRTKYSADLAAAYRDPADQVLSATAGAGVDLRIPSIYGFRLEIRHVEGLTPAFSGPAGEFKHRSTEILVRVGRHAL